MRVLREVQPQVPSDPLIATSRACLQAPCVQPRTNLAASGLWAGPSGLFTQDQLGRVAIRPWALRSQVQFVR